MLTLDKISLKINQKNLFSDLSLTLLPGGIFQIIGPNASGKTSLLEIISSISKPTQGKILVNELDIYQQIEDYRYAVNYLGHENNLMLNNSIIENISFWAKLTDHELLIEAALTHFGLMDIAERKCKSLSAGQKKLVQLSRLLVRPSEIWLLDEPFTNLDQEHKTQLKNLMILRARDNGIIIFTAHEKIDIPTLNCINLSDFKSK
jgi:heme exporter protein A